MARPETPLIRLEMARIEWRAKRRELVLQGRITPTMSAFVEWMDAVIANLTTIIDSWRMVTTIVSTAEGVYSETVDARFEEIKARRDYRHTA